MTLTLNLLHLRLRHMNNHDQHKPEHDYLLQLEYPQQMRQTPLKRNKQPNLGRQLDWCHDDELLESTRRRKPLRMNLAGPLSTWDTLSSYCTVHIQK